MAFIIEMKKITFYFVIIFILSILFSGCANMQRVKMEGNQSVGDNWACYSMSQEGVAQVSVKYRILLPFPGMGGTFTFTFKAIAEGETEIVMANYFRGGEPRNPITYRVVVDKWKNITVEQREMERVPVAERFEIDGTTLVKYHGEAADVTIPEGVTVIGDDAFRGLTSLANVTIPEGVASIGNSAFSRCAGLATINIPASVTSIGEFAFRDCTALINVNISNGLASIGDYAFFHCTGLAAINIPASVRSIGGRTFAGCANLTDIKVNAANPNYTGENGLLYNKEKTTLLAFPSAKGIADIPAGARAIGNFAFYDCVGLTGINIPDSVTEIGDFAFSNCASLTGIMVNTANPNFSSEDGVLYNKEKTTLLAYPSAKSVFTFPAGVTAIGIYAFRDCTGLRSITIPANITAIGNSAFWSWTSSQTINVQGKANQAAADSAWGGFRWRGNCRARIRYSR